MRAHTLTLYDEQGNPISIPAIRGVGIKEIRLKEAGETADTYEIILDNNRVFSFQTKHGKDYTLTEADKTYIAEEAAKMVDIPSEGQYELIDEFEIAEEGITQVKVDNLHLSRVIVNVTQPASIESGNGQYTARTTINGSTGYFDMLIPKAVTSPAYGTCAVRIENKRLFADVGVSLSYPMLSNYQQNRSNSLLGYYEMKTADINTVTFAYYDTPFPVGAKITIRGVKTNA